MRSLRQRKARAETGLFIVEGLHHVGEALEAGWEIDLILYTPDVLTSDFGRDLSSRAITFSGAAGFRASDGVAG